MSDLRSYQSILNQLNRDVSREDPSDVLQYCADWFQNKLREDRQGHAPTASPLTKSKAPGPLSSYSQQTGDLSPTSETNPRDSALASAPGKSVTGLFSSPFGAAAGAVAGGAAGVAGAAAVASRGHGDDESPFGEKSAPNSGPFGNQSPFGATPAAQEEDEPEEPEIPAYALGRRTSVSAESLVPTHARPFDPSATGFIAEEDEDAESNKLPAFPKTPDQIQRIKTAIAPNFLFRNLDEEQETDVLAAMKEVTVAPGETIIKQGDAGDYFYVVESGELDIFVNRDGQILESEKGDKPGLGKKVATAKEGGSFGELALMHNAPRAATIVAVTPSTLWALDRVSFRTILLDHTSRKRRLYETFLSTVPILSSLQPPERAKIADVLEARAFKAGEDVIKQGEEGDEFFLIESGSAIAIKTDEKGEEKVLGRFSKGDYFGELALLNRQTRAATMRAAEPLRVVALGEQAFTRLLGPVKDIMARSAGDRYVGYGHR